MNPPNRFKLSAQERNDPLWLKLSENFEGRIVELRERNDALDLTQEQTMYIRAQIDLYKRLLKI